MFSFENPRFFPALQPVDSQELNYDDTGRRCTATRTGVRNGACVHFATGWCNAVVQRCCTNRSQSVNAL